VPDLPGWRNRDASWRELQTFITLEQTIQASGLAWWLRRSRVNQVHAQSAHVTPTGRRQLEIQVPTVMSNSSAQRWRYAPQFRSDKTAPAF